MENLQPQVREFELGYRVDLPAQAGEEGLVERYVFQHRNWDEDSVQLVIVRKSLPEERGWKCEISYYRSRLLVEPGGYYWGNVSHVVPPETPEYEAFEALRMHRESLKK